VKSFSIGEAIAFGWESWKQNLALWLGVGIVYFLVELATDLLTQAAGEGSRRGDLAAIIGLLLSTFFTLGLTRLTLRFVHGERGPFSDLYTAYPLYPKFLVTSVMVGILVGIGSFLLIVPGIILAVILAFAPYVVVDQGMGPFESLSRSADVTRGARWKVFAFGLARLGLNLLGLIALVVGLLVTYPITMLAAAYVYRRLDEQTPLALAG
jgi:uncharacterized membrane protein